MKKLLSAVLSAAILTGTIWGSTQLHVSAYDVFGRQNLINLADAKCNYNSNTASVYGVRTMRGATGWNYLELISFDMYWKYHSDYSSSNVYVTTYSENNSKLATTVFYQKNSAGLLSEVDPEEENWNFCVIKINAWNQASLDYTTMVHEFGHVLGLSHRNTDPTSIMCQASYGRTAQKPSASDITNLNYLYG